MEESGLILEEFYDVLFNNTKRRLRFKGQVRNGRDEILLAFQDVGDLDPDPDWYGAKWEVVDNTATMPVCQLVATHMSTTNAAELRPLRVEKEDRFNFIK